MRPSGSRARAAAGSPPPGRWTPPASAMTTARMSSCAMTVAPKLCPRRTSARSRSRRSAVAKSFSRRLNQRHPPRNAASAISMSGRRAWRRSEMTRSGGEGRVIYGLPESGCDGEKKTLIRRGRNGLSCCSLRKERTRARQRRMGSSAGLKPGLPARGLLAASRRNDADGRPLRPLPRHSALSVIFSNRDTAMTEELRHRADAVSPRRGDDRGAARRDPGGRHQLRRGGPALYRAGAGL